MKLKLLLSCTILFANYANAQVGIGVTVPRMKMDVSAPDSAVLLLENNTTQSSGVKAGLFMRSNNRYMGGVAARATSNNDASLGFYTYSTSLVSGLQERMTILDNGNTGINVINPTAKLDVGGTLRFRNGAGTGKVLTSDADGNATWENANNSGGYGVTATTNAVLTVNSSYDEVNFNSEQYDDGNMLSGTTFTAPIAGVYHFSFSVDDATFLGAALVDDNRIIVTSSSGTHYGQVYVAKKVNGTAGSAAINYDKKMSAGDTETFQIKYAMSGNPTVTVPAGRIHLSIHKVY